MSIYKSDLDLLEPGILNEEPGINAWFTLKNADQVNSNEMIPGLDLGFNTDTEKQKVVANRDLLFKALELEPDWTAFAEQVHGNRVQLITTGGIYPETDGLLTRVPGLAIGILVADCAAVLLADPVLKIVGAVHAGWRGAAGNILVQAVQKMREEGSEPGNIKGWISPCICQRHFEVGEEVAEQFPGEFVDRESYDKPHVNLKGFLKYQLVEQGIPGKQVEVAGGCTMENEVSYYSYRREQDKSGRMMGIIQIAD